MRPGSGPESDLTEDADLPAMLADDGRGPVAILNEARDRALRVGGRLDRLEAASAGLTRVQKLVERLRDVAVVALDRTLQPAERARLQRRVDLALTEIDTVADETTVDEWLIQGRATPVGVDQAEQARPTPFRAIGRAALGLSEIAVRSSDQALAVVGALDVATSRLQRSAESLGTARTRLEAALERLTSPGTTATGDAALGNGTVALSSSMLPRRQLAANPSGAARAQAGLDVARVMRLLDLSSR